KLRRLVSTPTRVVTLSEGGSCNAADEVREAKLSISNHCFARIYQPEAPEVFESLALMLRISLQRFPQHDTLRITVCKARQNALSHCIGERRILRCPA